MSWVTPDLQRMLLSADGHAISEHLRDRIRRERAWIPLPFSVSSRLITAHETPKVTMSAAGEFKLYDMTVFETKEEAEACARTTEMARIRELERIKAERAAEIEAERAAESARWGALSLSERLGEVNGRRRTRVLSVQTVSESVRNVASWPASWIGKGILVDPIGLVSAKSYFRKAFGPSYATLALIVRVRRAIVLDVGQSNGSGSLQSVPRWYLYRRDLPGPSEALRIWSEATERLRLTLPQARRVVTL